MHCADCDREFASNFLKSFTWYERIGMATIPHVIQLCKTCLEARNARPNPIMVKIGAKGVAIP